MELVVESGVGQVGTNSWVTLEEADAYHAENGNAVWAAQTEERRTGLLIRAVRTVIVPKYAGRWVGVPYQDSQTLPWPRWQYLDEENRRIDVASVPLEVKYLQCEVALNFLTDPTSDTPVRYGLTIDARKVGPISTTKQYDSKQSPVLRNPVIARLVRPLLGMASNSVEIVRA